MIRIIYLLLICHFTICHSQTNKLHYTDSCITEIQKSQFLKVDSIGCVKYIKICQIKASNDSILLSNKFFSTKSRTFQEILKKEYYVYNEEIINGDIVIKEYDCFQKCMLCRLYDKYGKDVLHKIENKSDSLDKINKGYQNPSMVNNQLLIDVFKKEFKYKNLIVTKPEMVFL